MKKADSDVRKCYITGRSSGIVYEVEDKFWDFICKIIRTTIVWNPTHFGEMKDLCLIEGEIVRMTINLFNGEENCCGFLDLRVLLTG